MATGASASFPAPAPFSAKRPRSPGRGADAVNQCTNKPRPLASIVPK